MNTQTDEFLTGLSFNYNTPDGPAYIHIVEGSPGKIKYIFYNIGKAGTSVNAWAYSLAKMVEFSLRNGADFHSVLNELSNITSERMVRFPNGVEVHSGPEALFLALLRYHQSIKKPEKQHHGPRINRQYRIRARA